MAFSSGKAIPPRPNGLQADFFYLLLHESWKKTNVFPNIPWVSIDSFVERNSGNYGTIEFSEGLKNLQNAAFEAHSYIVMNPGEVAFQMISRENNLTASNKIIHMYVKCLLLYSEGPIAYPMLSINYNDFEHFYKWDRQLPTGEDHILSTRICSDIRFSSNGTWLAAKYIDHLDLIDSQTFKIRVNIYFGHRLECDFIKMEVEQNFLIVIFTDSLVALDYGTYEYVVVDIELLEDVIHTDVAFKLKVTDDSRRVYITSDHFISANQLREGKPESSNTLGPFIVNSCAYGDNRLAGRIWRQAKSFEVQLHRQTNDSVGVTNPDDVKLSSNSEHMFIKHIKHSTSRNEHEPSRIFMESNKVILRLHRDGKEEGKILATLPSGPEFKYSLDENSGTLVAADKLGSIFAIKICFGVSQHNVSDVLSSISELFGCDATEDDINLFNCFTENNGITWMMQDSHFLDTFSDGYAIYDHIDHIPAVLKHNEKITQVTVKSIRDTSYTTKFLEEKGIKGSSTNFTLTNEQTEKGIQVVGKSRSTNASNFGNSHGKRSTEGSSSTFSTNETLSDDSSYPSYGSSLTSSTHNSTPSEKVASIPRTDSVSNSSKQNQKIVIFDPEKLTPLGTSILFWVFAPNESNSKLLEAALKVKKYSNCFINHILYERKFGSKLVWKIMRGAAELVEKTTETFKMINLLSPVGMFKNSHQYKPNIESNQIDLVIPLSWTYFYNLPSDYIDDHCRDSTRKKRIGDYGVCLSCLDLGRIRRMRPNSGTRPNQHGESNRIPLGIFHYKSNECLFFNKDHELCYAPTLDDRFHFTVTRVSPVLKLPVFELGVDFQISNRSNEDNQIRNMVFARMRQFESLHIFFNFPMKEAQEYLWPRMMWLKDLLDLEGVFPVGINQEFLINATGQLKTGTPMKIFVATDCSLGVEALKKRKVKQLKNGKETYLVLAASENGKFHKVKGELDVDMVFNTTSIEMNCDCNSLRMDLLNEPTISYLR